MEHEEFMGELRIEAHDDLSIKDHIKFTEVLTSVHNSLPRDVESTVEASNEERNEFVTSVVTVEREEVAEVAAKSLKEFTDKSESQAWLQLIEKFVVPRDLILIVERLNHDVLLDVFIE